MKFLDDFLPLSLEQSVTSAQKIGVALGYHAAFHGQRLTFQKWRLFRAFFHNGNDAFEFVARSLGKFLIVPLGNR